MNANLVEGITFLAFVLILYAVYFVKGDKKKVKDASKKSVKVFIQNSVRVYAVFVIIAILQKFISPEAVSSFLLRFNGLTGILAGALAGSVMMGPGATSYPIGQYLLSNGAGYAVVSAFLFTWVGIGVVSIPYEFKFLGKKFTVLRNSFTFVAAIFIALLMGVLL